MAVRASCSLLQVFKVVKVEKELTPDFYWKRIMPVGLFMAFTLYFGNLAYLYLTVRPPTAALLSSGWAPNGLLR